MSTFLSSLRVRMILLIFAALIPAWAMMLYSFSTQRAIIESEVMKESLRAAELAANQEEQVIEGARQVLTALHVFFRTFPDTRSGCGAFLKQLAGEFRQYSNLGVVDQRGKIICSALPHHGNPDVGNSDWFQTALHSMTSSVGDDPAGSLTGKPVLIVTAGPVTAPGDPVENLHFATIDLGCLDDFHVPAKMKSVSGSFLALVDQNGAVLSLFPELLRRQNHLQDGKFLAAIAQGSSKIIMGEDSQGSSYIYAISPVRSRSPSRAVSVVFGMPKDLAFGEANRTRNRNLAGLGALSVLVIGTFWVLGSSVFLRRLGSLVAATQRLADGDLKARSGLTLRSDELGHLAKAFDGMAQALEQREKEQQEAEARIRSSEDQLRRLQTHVQKVREEERVILAREIHDDLGQALTALKIDISWLRKRGGSVDPPAVQDRLDAMSKILDEAMNTVHHVVSELRPTILDDLGLGEAIEWQTEEFHRRTGVFCEVAVSDDEGDLSPEQSTVLFRIFQEGLTNVARHSGATLVKVSLDIESNRAILTIGDNGRGIRSEEIESPFSYGLLGMRERACSLGGELEITGDAGSGTQLKVSVPVASR